MSPAIGPGTPSVNLRHPGGRLAQGPRRRACLVFWARPLVGLHWPGWAAWGLEDTCVQVESPTIY